MGRSQHRLGISEVNLVERHLKIESFVDVFLNKALRQIDELYGIDHVSFDRKPSMLNLSYDASRINIDLIENILDEYKIVVSHDWWNQFKEGYYRFVDQNVKDNANHQPACCNKIPPEAKKK